MPYFWVPDMVALPEVDQIDAVENWGLITYHETAISYKLNETSVSTIQLTTSAIAHSLAHQVKDIFFTQII